MEKQLTVTQGYMVESEQDVKNAIDNFRKNNPEIDWDGATKNDIVKVYRNKTKPYKHIVFIKIKDSWFIQFLTDEEVLLQIPGFGF